MTYLLKFVKLPEIEMGEVMCKDIDILDERIKISELFDYYGTLLKTGQSKVLKAYILDDLSLSEIAELKGVSRQGVYDNLRRSIKRLQDFDEKLHLIKKSKEVDRVIASLREISDRSENKNITENIKRLEKIF